MRYMATPRKRYFVFRHVPITLAEIAHDHAACVSVAILCCQDPGLLTYARDTYPYYEHIAHSMCVVRMIARMPTCMAT